MMTDNTFQRYSDKLYEQMFAASSHYDLYVDLREALKEHGKAMNKSPRFWSLTFNAHLEACRMSLCRLYDQEKNSLGLYKWLKYFKDHFEPVHHGSETAQKHHAPPLNTGDIDKDLIQVGKKDPKVKKLIILRNSDVAHLSAKNVAVEKSILDRYPMTYPDYKALISRAETVFNRYHVLHFGVYRSPKTLQQEKDYKYVFDSISDKTSVRN